MAQYVIGVDFGSLSGRAVLVDSRTGQIAAQRTVPYAHGVMTEGGAGWALHHPADYLDVLETAVPQVLRDASVTAEQVTAIGWDVTACTMLPVQADGTPLCAGVTAKPEGLAAGELMLRAASGAYIHLKNNGEVEINGQVFAAKTV